MASAASRAEAVDAAHDALGERVLPEHSRLAVDCPWLQPRFRVLEQFHLDCTVDAGRCAGGTALQLLAMVRHVASSRLASQGETALVV